MAIRAVLFDIGDTLLPASDLQRGTLRETARDLGATGQLADPEGFVTAYEEADRDPHFDALPDLNHLYSDPRVVVRAFELLGVHADPGRVDAFLQAYRSRLRARIRPDPALTDMLSALRSAGVELGIVSNGTTVEQLEQLERMGIKDFFDPILVSEEVGIRKPDPAIFLHAAEYMGIPPSDILVVGDREDWEVRGARNAGMQSALLLRFANGNHAAPGVPGVPDYVIQDLSSLPEIVRNSNASGP